MGQPVRASNTFATAFIQQLSYGIGPTVTDLPAPVSLRSLFQASGTAADQCNLVVEGRISLSASTPQSLDLRSGALLDLAGLAAVFARVDFLLLRNNATADGWVLTVGNSGANDWTGVTNAAGTFLVYPSTGVNDGFSLFQMPGTTGAVADSTHKIIKLDPGAHAFTVDYLIAGRDA